MMVMHHKGWMAYDGTGSQILPNDVSVLVIRMPIDLRIERGGKLI